MKTQIDDRKNRLMPNGTPRYVRVYDNVEAFDRYTVVFTGHYRRTAWDRFVFLGMSENPFHPQGFGQHGESSVQIDRPTYSHLGKKIQFKDLPKDCQTATLQTYVEVWDLK